MNCLKCGREPEAGKLFCPECLEDMQQHPIRINTPVHIPQQPAKKSSLHRRPALGAEEQIRRLKRSNHQLILLMVLMAAVTIFCALLAFDVLERSQMYDLWGQNYSIIGTSEPETID